MIVVVIVGHSIHCFTTKNLDENVRLSSTDQVRVRQVYCVRTLDGMHPTSRQRLRHFLQANKSPNLWLQLRGTFSVTDYHIWIHLGSATSVYQKYRKCLCFVTGFLSQLEQGHATCHRGGDVQTRASRWATPRIATDSTLPWHGMAWLQPKDLSMQTVFRPNCAALMAPAGNSHGGPKPFESFEFQQIGYPCTTEGMDAIQDRFRTNW